MAWGPGASVRAWAEQVSRHGVRCEQACMDPVHVCVHGPDACMCAYPVSACMHRSSGHGHGHV